MDGLTDIISNVWEQGLFGIGVTEIIVSVLIFIIGAIARAFFVGSILKRLEKLTADTESEIDDVLLESLKKPLGYIPLTIAIYLIAVYLPLSGMAELFATNLIKAMIAFTKSLKLSMKCTPATHQNQMHNFGKGTTSGNRTKRGAVIKVNSPAMAFRKFKIPGGGILFFLW